MKIGTAAHFADAVDLAQGFVSCWTHDGQLDACEEWARQLRDELNRLFAPSETDRLVNILANKAMNDD